MTNHTFFLKPQAATDAGQSAVEYLATVVEFDAWDKLDKDWTSNVALRNMTPDNVRDTPNAVVIMWAFMDLRSTSNQTPGTCKHLAGIYVT